MANIIIADPEKVQPTDDKETVVSSDLDEVIYAGNHIYAPSSMLDDIQRKENVYVYLELENYPFFQKAKELIEKQDKPKGVFRYRRITKTDKDESLLVEDIAVITSLFGQPVSTFSKRTDRQNKPYHVIVTLNFGGGTMAHVEYTLANKNQIELEWSGIEEILAFHSDEMNPLIADENENLSLKFKTTSILNRFYAVDQKFLTKLEKSRDLLKDGVNR